MTTLTYHIPNISCHHCTHTISTELGDLPGVQDVQADLQSRQVVVHFNPPATEQQVVDLLKEINYPPELP
jgi:copper chaperone CopZ